MIFRNGDFHADDSVTDGESRFFGNGVLISQAGARGVRQSQPGLQQPLFAGDGGLSITGMNGFIS